MKTRPPIGAPVMVGRYSDGTGGKVLGRVSGHAADPNVVHVMEMSRHCDDAAILTTRAVNLRQLTLLVEDPTPWRLQAAAWLRGQATAQGDGLLQAMVEPGAVSDEEARAGAAVWSALVTCAEELEQDHRGEEERDAQEG